MGLTEKYLLKRSMKGLLPEAVRTRSKQPYRAPDNQSFFRNGQAVPYVSELLSERRLAEAGYFDPVAVGKLLAKCRAGRAIGGAAGRLGVIPRRRMAALPLAPSRG